MINRKYLYQLLFLFLQLVAFHAYSLELDIRIYSGAKIRSFQFQTVSGSYDVIANGENILHLSKYQKVDLSFFDDSVMIKKDGDLLGKFDSVCFAGKGLLSYFQITSVDIKHARRYDDDLIVLSENKLLKTINHVDLEKYVAGVVQAESGGSTTEIGFFYVQAVTCRTYALNNYQKHKEQGFHLCDAVHCQVYKGRCTSSTILRAVMNSMGEVIIDSDSMMISAAFHSNSGGYTINSEDVWSIPVSYLKAKEDTFSIGMKNTFWETKIDKQDFLEFLSVTYGLEMTDSMKVKEILSFEQLLRKKYLVDSIPLKDIRKQYNLKSTYFSIYDQGEELLLKGRGYGHGVGLSQEGAIKMAHLGYNYKDIIKYYYTDVVIVNFLKLKHLVEVF
jgi:stage II sporulation protein D